jgi:hypothetical protein
VAYEAQGAEEFQPELFGLVIDRLSARPAAGDKPIIVASGATNSDPAGAPATINSSIKHPHGQGGTGYMTYHVAQRSPDGSVQPVAGGAPRMDNAPYEPVTLDKRSVTANIEITFEPHKTGEDTTTKATSKLQAAEEGKSNKVTSGLEASAGTKDTAEVSKGTTKDVSRGKEQQKTTGEKTGIATTISGTLTLMASTTDTKLTETSYGGEFSANGSILALLLAAAGPEGLALLTVLAELKVLDSTTFKVNAQKKDSVSFSVVLSGQVQLAYSQQRSKEESASQTDVEKKEEKKGEQKGQKKGTEVSAGTVKKTGAEQENSVKKTQSTGQTTGEAKTRIAETPIIKDSKLAFGVKKSKGQPAETADEKPAAQTGAGAAGTKADAAAAGADKEAK